MKFLSSLLFLCAFTITSTFADEQSKYEEYEAIYQAYKKGLGDGVFEINNYVLKDIEDDIKETISICENIMAHQGTENRDTVLKLYRSISQLKLKAQLNYNQMYPYLANYKDIRRAFNRAGAEDYVETLNDKYALYTDDELSAIVKEANNLMPKNSDDKKKRKELLNLRVLALYKYALRKEDTYFLMNNKKITDNLYYEKGYFGKSRLEKALDSVVTEEEIKKLKIYTENTWNLLFQLDFLTDSKIDSDINLSNSIQAYNEYELKLRVTTDDKERELLQENLKSNILPNMKKYSYEYSKNFYDLMETIAELKIYEYWY